MSNLSLAPFTDAFPDLIRKRVETRGGLETSVQGLKYALLLFIKTAYDATHGLQGVFNDTSTMLCSKPAAKPCKIATDFTLGVLVPMTRIYIAGVIVLFALVLAVMALIAGQPVAALSLALAGVYCGLGVTLGVCQSISNPLFQAAAVVIGAIGLLAVFLYHRGFDVKLQEAHLAALSSFVRMDIYCKPMPMELRNIMLLGVNACATQDNANQMSATVELAKGLYFGPTLSIADSAYSAGNQPAKDYCALAYQAAAAACQDAFISLSPEHKAALLGAVK